VAINEQQFHGGYRDPLLGSVIGNYVITRQIGEGGMGAVYEARNDKLGGKRFAIKVMLLEYSTNAEVVERFVREALAAARVDHPRITTVLDCGTINGRPYQIMPFLVGQELTEYMNITGIVTPFDDNRRLPLPVAAPFLLQIFDGIAALHDNQIIHRDIKGSNVFVMASDQSIKILDFGIAKLADPLNQLSALTGARRVVGTVGYMSPEQAGCEAIDHRADIWSLGALMYRMLVGRLPFVEHDYIAFNVAVRRTQPPSPLQFVPDLPPALSELILACLHVDRAKRPASVKQLFKAFVLAVPDGRRIARTVAPSLAVVSSHDERTLAALPETTEMAAVSPMTVVLSADAPPPVRTQSSSGRRTPIIVGVGIAAALAMTAAAYHLGKQQTAPAPVATVAVTTDAAPVHADAAVQRAAVVVVDAPPPPPIDAAIIADASPPARIVDAPSIVAIDAPVKKPPTIVVTPRPHVAVPHVVSPPSEVVHRRITILVKPWAMVSIDGKSVGQTPYAGELAVGTHVIRMTNSDANKSETLRIKVTADSDNDVQRDWQ
jgi:serine/threonine protein kinase